MFTLHIHKCIYNPPCYNDTTLTPVHIFKKIQFLTKSFMILSLSYLSFSLSNFKSHTDAIIS